jgi:hypothetical protein
MTAIESELLGTLIGLYAWECLFWIGPDRIAWSRAGGARWQAHRCTASSFTLLGRRPVLSDPLLIRPGVVRDAADADAGRQDRALRRTERRLSPLWLLTVQCRWQAFLLLVLLPFLLYRGLLLPLWRPYSAVLLASHVLLIFSVAVAMQGLRNRRSVLAPIVLNPLGATRVLDVLAEVWYEHYAPISAAVSGTAVREG